MTSSFLLRLAAQMRAADQAAGDRVYDRLRDYATAGGEIADMTDFDLVRAIQRAVWHDERLTAQLGLGELELRLLAKQEEERLAA